MNGTIDGFWDAPAPRVFTAAGAAAFLPALARGAVALAGPEPEALGRATLLLPTRRAARALADAILQVLGAPAAVLPRIVALADIETDAAALGPSVMGAEALWATPPALSAHQRRFDLLALLHAKAAARDPDADPAASLALADALARLLDEAAEAGADLSAARRLYTALPAHLQEAAAFLEIVGDVWPQRVAELGRLDPAARRDRLLRAAAAAWRERPPEGLVIAAGSTGSVAATAALLEAVAHAPRGCVVLPGLDLDADAAAWEAVDDQHPQAGLKHLLEALGVARTAVRPWPFAPAVATPAVARRRLISEALRPADATADWRGRLDAAGPDAVAAGLAGLAVCEAPDEDREARVVALAARHQLETPDATVMIVTPDAGLSERVAVALTRWAITAEVSAGRPPPLTRAGGLLALVAEIAGDPGDPAALAALLKHPLARFGRAPETVRAAAVDLERAGLRGVRAGADLTALARRLETTPEAEQRRRGANAGRARALLETITQALAPLIEPAAAERRALADWAERHARATEAVAGARDLWGAEGGAEAADLIRALLSETDAAPPMDRAGYGRVFARLAGGTTARAPEAEGARVRILGPLEARLLDADLVILCGLNEGVWPASPPIDPFLSRGMRAAVGLSPQERDIGRAAHDFEQLAAAPRVLLTRAQKADGAPSVASRWLWRLQTLCRGAGLDLSAAATPETVFGADYLAIAEALDAVPAEAVRPASPPRPTPPTAARPRRLAATDVGRWIRDPYWIFARRILGLTPLEPLDRPPDARDRGIAIHEALYAALTTWGEGAIEDEAAFAERLAQEAGRRLRESGMAADALAREQARAERAAAWFAAWERARRVEGWRPAALEVSGARSFETPAGAFTLTARADRIDRRGDEAAVLDYKTGAPPTDAQVAAGLEPQLALEAAILADGGFPHLPALDGETLIYVRWRGGREAGAAKALFAETARAETTREAVAASWTGLIELVTRFDDPATPYLSHVRDERLGAAGDFDRLARRKEWSAVAPEEG